MRSTVKQLTRASLKRLTLLSRNFTLFFQIDSPKPLVCKYVHGTETDVDKHIPASCVSGGPAPTPPPAPTPGGKWNCGKSRISASDDAHCDQPKLRACNASDGTQVGLAPPRYCTLCNVLTSASISPNTLLWYCCSCFRFSVYRCGATTGTIYERWTLDMVPSAST
jgi:hypothetical protein